MSNFILRSATLRGVVIAGLIIATPSSHAQQDKTATQSAPGFYLPVRADEFPAALTALKSLLSESELGDMQIGTSDHWHRYQQGLRHGRPGIYFAPPHYAAWAISRHGFVPMLRLAEPLSYVIAARRADASIFEIADLHNRRVCAEKPLNLDYLMINEAVADKLISADIRAVASVGQLMRDFDSQCAAFAVSEHIFERLAVDFPQRFIRLHQSARTNNYVLVTHPSVPEAIRQNLQAVLTSAQGQRSLQPILQKFANRTRLTRASREDYPDEYAVPLTPYWQ